MEHMNAARLEASFRECEQSEGEQLMVLFAILLIGGSAEDFTF